MKCKICDTDTIYEFCPICKQILDIMPWMNDKCLTHFARTFSAKSSSMLFEKYRRMRRDLK